MTNWLWLLVFGTAMEAVCIGILLLGNLKEQVTVFVPLTLTNGLLYLIGTWQVCKNPPRGASPPAEEDSRSPISGTRRRLAVILLAGLLFRLTLFPLYPSLSDDLFRYRWDGKMMAAGYNPYRLPPDAPSLKHLRDSTWEGVNGKYHVAVYGPLTESLFRWWYPVTMLAGRENLSVLLMKVPMLLFDLGTALLLLRLLRILKLPAERVLIYWWAPVTVIEFAASGHNDSVGVFFLVLALLGLAAAATPSPQRAAAAATNLMPGEAQLQSSRNQEDCHPEAAAAASGSAFDQYSQRTGKSRSLGRRGGLGMTGSPLTQEAATPRPWTLLALMLATLSKLLAAFIWPVVLPLWLERRRWRDFVWPAVAAVLIYWPFRDTLLDPVPSITQYSGNWRNNDSLFGAFYALTGSPLAASAAAGAVVAAVAGFLAGRRVPPIRAAFLVLGTLLACSAQVFPWYFAWILPLLAVFPNTAWLMLSVLVFLSYNVLIGYGALGVWKDNAFYQWLEYAPFYALLVGGYAMKNAQFKMHGSTGD